MKNKFAQYTDEELISIVRAGKSDTSQAFSELFDKYALKVKVFCKYMLNNREQAEDILQDTFINFYNNIKAGKIITNTGAYLISSARNLCLKYFRDRKIGEVFDFEISTDDEHRLHEKNELFELIVKALSMLDPIYKEAFILREFQGLQFNAVAEILGIPIQTVKTRVYRAQQQIRDILSDYTKDLSKY